MQAVMVIPSGIREDIDADASRVSRYSSGFSQSAMRAGVQELVLFWPCEIDLRTLGGSCGVTNFARPRNDQDRLISLRSQ